MFEPIEKFDPDTLPKPPPNAERLIFCDLTWWLKEVARVGGRPGLEHVWDIRNWPGNETQRGRLTSIYLEMMAQEERRELGYAP